MRQVGTESLVCQKVLPLLTANQGMERLERKIATMLQSPRPPRKRPPPAPDLTPLAETEVNRATGEQIERALGQLIQIVRKREPFVAAFLSGGCQAVAVEGKRISVMLRDAHLLEMVSRSSSKLVIQDASREALGPLYDLRFVGPEHQNGRVLDGQESSCRHRTRMTSWHPLGDQHRAHIDRRYANLSQTILNGCNFNGEDLTGANLTEANLSGASLCGAVLTEANLRNANLIGADLSWANLDKADARGAKLPRAMLLKTSLREADLREADLRRVLLAWADLTDARVAPEQLAQATILKGTTLPDGTVHE